MLGLLVIIVVSWGLLYLIEKKNITVLGIIPNQKRVMQFILGFLFISIVTLSAIYIETLIKSIVWESKTVDYNLIYQSFIYHIRSALTEDLVFRGAVLYILISKLGSKKAILISALFFGVYHVFSYGMAGNVPILYVILVTGFTGYVWAYTFDKTKSIALGLGFHLGCNLMSIYFFPSQPYGELLFTKVSGVDFLEWNKLYFLLFKGLYPSVLTLLFLKLMLKYNVKLLQSN